MALSSEEKVAKILKRAAPKAAKLLLECIEDDSIAMKQRYDASIEVLTRLFGKTAAATAEVTANECGRLEVVFKNEAKDYAQ